VLVAMRFVVAEEFAADFDARARAALGALAARPGYLDGQLGRAFDDPTHWCLTTRWASVGAYRRALGAYDVKMYATPLLAQAVDEPSAFETLAEAAAGGEVVGHDSDMRYDSDRAGPGAGTLRSAP